MQEEPPSEIAEDDPMLRLMVKYSSRFNHEVDNHSNHDSTSNHDTASNHPIQNDVSNIAESLYTRCMHASLF